VLPSCKKIILCPRCNFSITAINFNTHFNSCKGIGPLLRRKRKYKRVLFNKRFTRDFCAAIQVFYNNDNTVKDTIKKFNINTTSWTKAVKLGLIKSRSCSETSKIKLSKLSAEERKEKYTVIPKPWHKKRGGYREKSGRSKKYYYVDSFGKLTCLQSSYEKECAVILNDLKVQWLRPKALKYDNKRYYADFYLPEFNLYLDPKNDYLAIHDQEKIQKVIIQNNVKVVILTKKQLTKDFILNLLKP
jgi:hypothetical protein